MFPKRKLICGVSSAESIGHNEYLITQISLRLPVKSILRFRSVSKQWKSLLTDPHFINLHASHKSTNSFLFMQLRTHLKLIESVSLKEQNHSLEISDLRFMMTPALYCLELMGSCNGLLLFNNGENYFPKCYVCNPSTRKYTEFQLPYHIVPFNLPLTAFLAFDPSKSPDFQIIIFWVDHSFTDEYQIAIYSPKTRICRKIGCTLKADYGAVGVQILSGVFLNGAIHFSRIPFDNTSLYFDIERECVNVLPKPPCSATRNNVMYFGACQGHLYVILNDPKELSSQIIDVYELKEDYSSWDVKYRFNMDDIFANFSERVKISRYVHLVPVEKYYEYCFRCVVKMEEEEEEGLTLVLSVRNQFRNQFLAYNFKKRTTKKLCDIPPRVLSEIKDKDTPFLGCYQGRFQASHCNETLYNV